MSELFDIDALPDKELATPEDQPPKKWLKHDAAEWYFTLQELKQARQDIIKKNPADLTKDSCVITHVQFSEAIGKHKSHLAPSKWQNESTDLEKAKAFMVKELQKVNDRLLRDWKLAMENRRQATSPAKSKAALARELKEAMDRLEDIECEAWGSRFGQINHDSQSLANKVADLEGQLKAAKESSDNQRRTHQDTVKARAHDLEEIKRLTQLNAALDNELKEAEKVIEELRSAPAGARGELVLQLESEVNVSAPPASINPVAWAEWLGYRAGKRKKVSPAAATKQWEMLSKYPHAVQAQIINDSIANDYQGLFPPKGRATETRMMSLEENLTDTSWAD